MIIVFMEAYDAGTDRLLAKMGYSAEDIKRLRPSPGLQSVAAAIQNMLLAAHALGYSSCWMTGPTVAQEAFEKLLGYGKEKFVAALLPVGVPDENPPSRPEKADPRDDESDRVTVFSSLQTAQYCHSRYRFTTGGS